MIKRRNSDFFENEKMIRPSEVKVVCALSPDQGESNSFDCHYFEKKFHATLHTDSGLFDPVSPTSSASSSGKSRNFGSLFVFQPFLCSF